MSPTTRRSPFRAWLIRTTRAESVGDAAFKWLTLVFALLLVATFAALVYVLADRAWPAIRAFGAGFLWSQEWDPPGQRFGALAYVVGTTATSVIGLLVALPISVGTAVAITQMLSRRVAIPFGFLVELLAAIPSIIFGVWGLAVVVPRVRSLGGEGTFGPSILAAGVVLAAMMLPIMTAVTRDLLLAVPRHQKEAALALGATRWEVTWRVLLPHSRAGILAAAILGLGRGVGETMAVIMVVGNQARLPHSVFDPGATMASLIANEFGDPSGPLHAAALVELGLVLVALSLLLNVAARLIVRMLTRKKGAWV